MIMNIMIGIIGIVSNLIIVLLTIQSKKERSRNVTLNCATHEFKVKTM